MSETERLQALEEKLAFQQHELSQLHDAVLAQHRTITSLEEEVETLKRAVQRLSSQPLGEVLGAYGGDDPVPSSG